jgi:hypothetical protein
MGGRPFSIVASTTNLLILGSNWMLMSFSQLAAKKQKKRIMKYLMALKQPNGWKSSKKSPAIAGL